MTQETSPPSLDPPNSSLEHLTVSDASGPTGGLTSKTVGGKDVAPTGEEAPLYEHDCEHCVFLGRFDSAYMGELRTFDLYYHAPTGKFPLDESVIARFGQDGDYYSGMHFAKPYKDITGAEQDGIPMLVEALRRSAEATPNEKSTSDMKEGAAPFGSKRAAALALTEYWWQPSLAKGELPTIGRDDGCEAAEGAPSSNAPNEKKDSQ